jgi:hypothetical protein
MRKYKEYEFGKDFMVYVIENGEQTSCFNYMNYLENKEKYAGKVLVIVHKDIPVYFRRG